MPRQLRAQEENGNKEIKKRRKEDTMAESGVVICGGRGKRWEGKVVLTITWSRRSGLL